MVLIPNVNVFFCKRSDESLIAIRIEPRQFEHRGFDSAKHPHVVRYSIPFGALTFWPSRQPLATDESSTIFEAAWPETMRSTWRAHASKADRISSAKLCR